MQNRSKYWLIALLGVILILVAGMASVGRNRVPDAESRESDNSEQLSNYLREQDTIMAEMMRDMEDIPKTGSADIDFLNGMVPHHQSAVAMAESYLNNGGQDQRLTKLAGEIIEVQEKEIDQMKTMISRLEKSGKKNEEKEEAYLTEYRKMFASHQMDHSGTAGQSGSEGNESMAEDPHAMHGPGPETPYTAGGVDAAFAEGMIMHHQMAVDMAQAILAYTGDEEVETLSNAIIQAQEKEIGEMQEILKSLTDASS